MSKGAALVTTVCPALSARAPTNPDLNALAIRSLLVQDPTVPKCTPKLRCSRGDRSKTANCSGVVAATISSSHHWGQGREDLTAGSDRLDGSDSLRESNAASTRSLSSRTWVSREINAEWMSRNWSLMHGIAWTAVVMPMSFDAPTDWQTKRIQPW